ncbi:MAG: substrate-binding domain-containing protein [Candidatus Sulfotelmatobacter sp.]
MRNHNLWPTCTSAWCILALSVVSVGALAQTPAAHPTLRTVREVRELSNVEARNAYPVQLEGVATYSDQEWGLLFLADATGAIYVNIHGMNAPFPAGSRLRVDAVTGPGDVGTVLAQPTIHVLGQGVLPAAEHRSVADLDALKADSHFIETRGVLWACDQSWKRICFRIADGKSSALVVVPTRSTAAAQKLVGATVRVHGVSGIHLDANGKPLSALIFVNRIEDIEVEGGASQNLNALAVIVNKDNPVSNLSTEELRAILLGKREYWKGSQKIQVLLPNGGTPEREAALRMVDMNDSTYKKYWVDRTSAGEAAAAPAAMPSSGIALSLVAESPGAIAVVPLADVRDSVKVVKIDGHGPSDAAYPIH